LSRIELSNFNHKESIKDISEKEEKFNEEITELDKKNKSIKKDLNKLDVQLKLEVDRYQEKYGGEVGNLIEEILQKME
jgi:predicted transcriptional regulator